MFQPPECHIVSPPLPPWVASTHARNPNPANTANAWQHPPGTSSTASRMSTLPSRSTLHFLGTSFLNPSITPSALASVQYPKVAARQGRAAEGRQGRQGEQGGEQGEAWARKRVAGQVGRAEMAGCLTQRRSTH